MALAGEIVESFCASAAGAERFDAPFVHFRVKHVFPAAVAEALAALPFTPQGPAAGRRESVKNRLYADRTLRAGAPLLDSVAEALQSRQVASALRDLCGAELAGTFLRLEYAVDTDGFWLDPHTDLGVKKFTGLIPLACEDGADDLGTDLYASPHTPFSRVPFQPNGGTFFVPGEATWHGFAPRPIEGLRKSLILNYVSVDWQSRDQLAFPDQPIAL
jgi:hypothetical protein